LIQFKKCQLISGRVKHNKKASQLTGFFIVQL